MIKLLHFARDRAAGLVARINGLPGQRVPRPYADDDQQIIAELVDVVSVSRVGNRWHGWVLVRVCTGTPSKAAVPDDVDASGRPMELDAYHANR